MLSYRQTLSILFQSGDPNSSSPQLCVCLLSIVVRMWSVKNGDSRLGSTSKPQPSLRLQSQNAGAGCAWTGLSVLGPLPIQCTGAGDPPVQPGPSLY